MVKDLKTYIFPDLIFFFHAFLLVYLYQGPPDREVALCSILKFI